MKKADRANYIMAKLEELYPVTPIPLDHSDPYTLLIAVLLSAQCTDKRVNLITPLLFKKAQTPEAMVKLSIAEIQEIIRPCGLSPAKAKAIHGLSTLLITHHGGSVPKTLAELEELPGVGHKTAQVVMAQAFGVPSFPVDTHIHRLATRWKLSGGKNVLQTERDLKALFPIERWNKLHLQMIYYGREHCGARSCDGTSCAICKAVGKPVEPSVGESSQSLTVASQTKSRASKALKTKEKSKLAVLKKPQAKSHASKPNR